MEMDTAKKAAAAEVGAIAEMDAAADADAMTGAAAGDQPGLQGREAPREQPGLREPPAPGAFRDPWGSEVRLDPPAPREQQGQQIGRAHV